MKDKKDSISDNPPDYNDLFDPPRGAGQSGHGRGQEPRPPSPSPSYHTIDIRKKPPPPPGLRQRTEQGPSQSEGASQPGRFRRAWRAWKDNRKPGISTEIGEDGWTELHGIAKASSFSTSELDQLLTQTRLNIDVKTTAGWTPLHVAILADKDKDHSAASYRISAFLERGADPTLSGKKGWNALQLAAAHGQTAAVALLLGPRYRHFGQVDAVVGWGKERGSEGTRREDAEGNLTTLTAIELAARHGCGEIVAMLLNADAKPGSEDRTTVMHEAAGWGQTAVVAMLLEQRRPGLDGIVIGNWKDHRGFTALDCAFRQDRGQTVRLLMDEGQLVSTLLRKERSPEHPATLLRLVVRLNCPSVLAVLLSESRYAGEVNTVNPADGLAPLHFSAMRGSYQVVKLLLDHGADPHKAVGSGWTPIQFAARYGQAHAVAVLLKVVTWQSYSMEMQLWLTVAQQFTPMHLSVFSGSQAIVRALLIQKWPIDVRTAKGHTPLHYACMLNQQDNVRLLLNRGADPVARDEDEMTPLLLAAEAGHVNVMWYLLLQEKDIQKHLPELAARELPRSYERILLPFLLNKKKGKGKNRLNDLVDGRAVLHEAVHRRHREIAELILQNGAQGFVKDHDGKTAAEVAATNADFEMVFVVSPEPLQQLEEVIHQLVRHKNVEQLRNLLSATPKPLRKQVRAISLAAAALTHTEQLIITLKRSISIDEDQGSGWRPLYIASLKGDHRAVQLLLRHGANPNLKTSTGITPLLQAAEGGYPKVIHLLLRRGAKAEERNAKGHTALQVAAQRGREEAVVALLERGVDVHAMDANGKTALDLALINGAHGVVKAISEFLDKRDMKQ